MSRERFEVGALQAHLEARRAKSRSRRSKAAEASVALAIAHRPTVWAAFSRAVQAQLQLGRWPHLPWLGLGLGLGLGSSDYRHTYHGCTHYRHPYHGCSDYGLVQWLHLP